MPVNAHEILSGIRTVVDMAKAFRDEDHCRSLLEALVWPNGRICPCCGYRKSIPLAGRDLGKQSRPGLYQCSNGSCRHQFTVTTRTPLHSTKLPLQTWLTGLWLILQSDKGISSKRLGEALGISQQAAWRMGHALRLLVAQNEQFAGTIEIDQFYFGTTPRLDAGGSPRLGRGRKGQPNTLKTPALAVVQRPEMLTACSPAGHAHAAVINNLSEAETDQSSVTQ